MIIAETDPNYEAHSMRFIEGLIVEINARIPKIENLTTQFRLSEAGKNFQQQGQYNAGRLFGYIRQCIVTERQLLYPNAQMCQPPLVADADQLTLMNEIRSLLAFVHSNGELNKQISLDYENFALTYHDFTKANINIQLMDNPRKPNDIDEQKQDIIKRRNDQIEYSFNQILHKILNLESDFEKIVMRTSNVLNKVVTKYIVNWKVNQSLTGNGARFADNLHILQDWFENLSDVIWNTREQIRLASKTRIQLQPVQPNLRDYLPQRFEDVTALLTTLITNAFIIEKQPPQVMKTNTR